MLDEVVRTTCAGGDADDEFRAVWEPIARGDFTLGVDIEMAEFFFRCEAVRIANEIGWQFLNADFDEVSRVGAIVTTDDDQEVERFAEEVE